jgi:hypothetical protein
VARSDDVRRGRRWLGAGLVVGLAAVVSGCATTQDEAARLQLNSARIRVAETHTVVRTPGRRVRVTRVSLVSSGRGSAIVVAVHNPGTAAIGDLPISVGVREPHRGRVALNSRPGANPELTYYSSHLPTVPAGGSLTWVYSTSHRLSRGAHPYALVGDRPAPAVTRTGSGRPPQIEARLVSHRATGPGAGRLQISLHNPTSVPQYQLQVYAVGRRAGREVAAGAVTVPHLGSHRTEAFALPVIGRLAHASLELSAVSTIDQ